MELLNNVKLKLVLNIIGALILGFFEPISYLLFPILWLVVIDIATAMYLIRIVKKESLTSRGFFKKLPQLVLFLIALIAALHADPFFVEFGITQYQAAKLVLSFYGLYELFSILENLGKSGLPIAKQLAAMLEARLPDKINPSHQEDQSDRQ